MNMRLSDNDGHALTGKRYNKIIKLRKPQFISSDMF